MILSPFPHPTVALAHARTFIEGEDRVIIYTDDEKTLTFLERAVTFLTGASCTTLTHPSELFSLDRIREKVILIPARLFRITGNIESIRRGHTVTIVRDTTHPQGKLIEKLLDIGYIQSDYRGEHGTYQREGSLIRICHGGSEWVIEYFDDSVESIIEYIPDGHRYHDHVTFGRIERGDTQLPEGDTPEIHLELLERITLYPLILISCEFSRERIYLHEKAKNITEYSSLTLEGSTILDVTRPSIEKAEELRSFLEKERDTTIITRYEKKVREFLDLNGLSHIRVRPTSFALESYILSPSGAFESSDNQTSHSSLLIADDILGKIFIENRVRKSSIKHLDLLLSIHEGDHIVHREHGIGRYLGLVKKRIGLSEREYMEIEYADNARVYVPLTELGRITKYVGEESVTLTSLEGKEWERTLSKTDEEVERIASEILETDAKRKLTKRIPFRSLPKEEALFLDAFRYTHTPDQRAIIKEIFDDMESDTPMDRLVSGDVGFGKTEVAMHAIYKAVLSGFQVAVISPLLILAEEHRETFEERLGTFGVRIASLTRVTRTRDAERILAGLKSGDIDVVVGTHRLLSDDIRFRRLGLLVIDEEHRFGVAHKERIKKIKAHIDILSLSATPIPRSMNLALSGLKKISLLTTPPPAKKPIDTIISRWDEVMIQKAIETELARGGQVIILHNRIRALPMIEREIHEIVKSEKGKVKSEEPFDSVIAREKVNPSKARREVPLGGEAIQDLEKQNSGSLHSASLHSRGQELRIITTHGQMHPDEIEDRIYDFKHGKYDILLTTTVIENGVNFLGANTIIISDAEEFGLAQLHQIRGRVGRKDVGGKCYLMYRKYELSSAERERLVVLAENSKLGSGYEIAMRDMQIRGTGDILGLRQSGKSKEVGISLYFQLLEEKVSSLKNGKKVSEPTKIELDLSYALGDDFFDSDIDKLSFYREIEAIETLDELERMEEIYLTVPVISREKVNPSEARREVPLGGEAIQRPERQSTGSPHSASLHSRGQELDSPLSNLFLMMRTQIILRQYGVAKLSKMGQNYHFDFRDGTTPYMLRAFLERFDRNHEMIIVSTTRIRVETTHWRDVRGFLDFLTI